MCSEMLNKKKLWNVGICVSFFKKIQQTGKVLQSGRFLFFHKNEVCSEFLRLRHI